MAIWSLLLMQSPLNTSTGTGLVCELNRASSRQMQFSVVDQATLDFSMPGSDPQTALIQPLVSDVLVYRDATVVQRFRVVSMKLTKDDGRVTANFSCVSYRGLLNAWMVGTDSTRSWASATEQTAIAYDVFADAQARPRGSLGVSKGPNPVSSVNRTLVGSVENYQPTDYLVVGTPVSEAITSLATMTSGFDWDIIPDPANEMTGLKFMTWTEGDGRRGGTALSSFILDDGGNVASWDYEITPSDYGNVMRLTGAVPSVAFNLGVGAPVWVPSSKDPGAVPEGRWERDINRSELVTDAAVAAAAQETFDDIHEFLPTVSVNLARGRWEGPAQLWLGSLSRLIISEPVTDSDDWLLYLDETARVVDIQITVDDLGSEDVSLTLNRRAPSATRDARSIDTRLRGLERK